MEQTKLKPKDNGVKIRVVGVSGTPIKGGNCDTMVQEALNVAKSIGNVETEFITMADKKVEMCRHCQYCIEHRVPCKIKDDHAMIIEALKMPPRFSNTKRYHSCTFANLGTRGRVKSVSILTI